MPGETTDFRLRFLADVASLRKGMEAGEVSAKDAQKAIDSLSSAYRENVREQRRLEKASKDSSKSIDSFGRSAERVAPMLGGAFGDAADVFFDVAGGLEAFAGKAGLVAGVAGAAALAASGVAAALHGVAIGGAEAVARLGEIEGSEPIDAAKLQSIDEYKDTTLVLEEAWQQLRVTLAAIAAEDMTNLVLASATVLRALNDMIGALRMVGETAALFNPTVLAYKIAVGALADESEDAAAGLRDVATSTVEVDAAQMAMLATLGMVVDEAEEAERRTRAMEDAQKRAKQAAQEYARDVARALSEQNAGYDRLIAAESRASAIQSAANAKFLTEEQQIQTAHAAEIRQLSDLARAGVDTREAMAAVDAAYYADFKRLQDAAAAEQAEALREMDAASEAAAQAELDRVNRLHEEWTRMRAQAVADTVQASIDIARAIAAAAEHEAEDIKENAANRINAIEMAREHGRITEEEARKQITAIRKQTAEEINQRRASAKTAFDIAQALSIATALIKGILLAIELTPAFIPIAGPFAPLVAIAAAGTMTAATIASISAVQPPEFPGGGMVRPDHQLVAAEPGEAVLSRRAVAQMGGEAGVAAANRGGETRGPMVVNLKLGGKMLGSVIIDTMKSQGGRTALGLPPLGVR